MWYALALVRRSFLLCVHRPMNNHSPYHDTQAITNSVSSSASILCLGEKHAIKLRYLGFPRSKRIMLSCWKAGLTGTKPLCVNQRRSCLMSQSPVDLASLFGAALSAVKSNQEQLNRLDAAKGAHGDNMVENMRIVTEALQAKQSQSPSDALRYASQMLQARGQGTSTQQYAQGLSQAADRLQGQSQMNPSDIMHLVSSILGSVQSGAGPQPGGPANALENMMGLASQHQRASQRGILDAALPAGVAFLQAKASGADNVTAAHRAVMSALTAGTVNPLQAGNAHSASAGLVAQSLLKALDGGM
jgi:hypothetical protein